MTWDFKKFNSADIRKVVEWPPRYGSVPDGLNDSHKQAHGSTPNLRDAQPSNTQRHDHNAHPNMDAQVSFTSSSHTSEQMSHGTAHVTSQHTSQHTSYNGAPTVLGKTAYKRTKQDEEAEVNTNILSSLCPDANGFSVTVQQKTFNKVSAPVQSLVYNQNYHQETSQVNNQGYQVPIQVTNQNYHQETSLGSNQVANQEYKRVYQVPIQVTNEEYKQGYQVPIQVASQADKRGYQVPIQLNNQNCQSPQPQTNTSDAISHLSTATQNLDGSAPQGPASSSKFEGVPMSEDSKEWPPQMSGSDANLTTITPSIFKMRSQAPVQQPPHQVYSAQPALKASKPIRMRGDNKWPPSGAVEAPQQPRELIRQPKQNKDYSGFFAQHQLPTNYTAYRAPPGTQHVGTEGTDM